MLKKIHWILFFLLVFGANAQDIHWSQYDYNPVFQNPANVGQFNGDYRFHANYRDQWRSVTVPFQTFSMSAEYKKFLHDRLSIGGFFFHDAAGDGVFTTVEFQPSISYMVPLTADSVHLFRGGLQFGVNHRRFDADAFTFDSQWDGFIINPSLPTNEQFVSENKTNFTIGSGVSYEFTNSKFNRTIVGLGYFNLNRPNQGFLGQDIRRERRFNFFARGEYQIIPNWHIIPSFQLNTQGTYGEFILGMQGRHVLVNNPMDYRTINFGAFIRNDDAFYLLLGMEYRSFWAGISYDINFSKLQPASRSRGGLEISVRYILEKIKKSKKTFRVCPDYI